MNQPLMPKATCVWLIDNTALTFEQIGAFCSMHALEVQAVADGEVAVGIIGRDPVAAGELTQQEIQRCEADPAARLKMAKISVPRASEDDYTRANALLYEDAKARGDDTARATALASLFRVPANQYRPEFLVEDAELAVRRQDWEKALAQATAAERHWARMPSDIVFSRLAMIHEVKAQAALGQFYASGGEDLDALDAAVRGWERYRDHVADREHPELLSRADEQLTRLYDMQRRMQ